MAEIFRIGVSGDDRNLGTACARDHGRIGAGGTFHVTQQRMAVPADHGIDARHFRGEFLILQIADMGQRQNLVDTGIGQVLRIGGQCLDLVLEDHAVRWRGGFRRIRREYRDDADLLAANLQHRRSIDNVFQAVVLAEVEIARNDRKGDPLGQHRQPIIAIVEFVVADGHGVIADGGHELDHFLALVGRIEQAALILIARVQQDDIATLGCDLIHQLPGLGGDPGHAAKAFARRRGFLVAGGIVFVDLLDTAVNIVGMQHMQHIFGLRRTG